MIELLIKETEEKKPDFLFEEPIPDETSYFTKGLRILEPSIQIDFITKIGTLLIAILSGFGAVNCPFNFFNFLDEKSKLKLFFFYDNFKKNFKKIVLQNKRPPIEEKLMFILKEISYNKYKLLVLSEQLKEEDLKPPEKIGFFGYFSWKNWKKPRNNKDQIAKEIKKTTEEIKTLKKAHNDTFFGFCKK